MAAGPAMPQGCVNGRCGYIWRAAKIGSSGQYSPGRALRKL